MFGHRKGSFDFLKTHAVFNVFNSVNRNTLRLSVSLGLTLCSVTDLSKLLLLDGLNIKKLLFG